MKLTAKSAILLLALLWSAYAASAAAYRYYAVRSAAETLAASRALVEPVDPGVLRRGHGRGAVILIFFTDFRCSECRRISVRLDSLLEAFPDLAVSDRVLVSKGVNGSVTAHAVYCANAQGAYRHVARAIYNGATEIEDGAWGRLAIRLAVGDSTTFASCVKERQLARLVQADSLAEVKLRLAGRPAIILGDSLYTVALELDELSSKVKALLPASEK